MKIEEAVGWALRVGGPLPYIGYTFSTNKEEIEKLIVTKYHHPIKVAVVSLREWRRLKKLDTKKK